MTIPKVPEGHPRVYVRPADLPAIRAKLDDPAFAHAWQVVQREADLDSAPMYGRPLCNAFLYLARGDRARGRRAIEETLAELRESGDARVFHQPFHWGACVYDWCYDLLSTDERQAFIREFIRIASLHRPGYPATTCNAVVGHDTEGWLLTGQLPAGVAIYDESPEMYEAAARLFFREFVPVRNYYYPSHAHHQGDHYTTRIIYDLAASWLFRRMGAGDVLSRHQQFVPYHYVYNLLPNRRQFMRGDGTGDIRSGRRKTIMLLAGSYYDDGRLLGLADSDLFDNQLSPYHEVFELLLRPPGVANRPVDDLPLTKRFGPPINDMVARTGWTLGPDSRDAVVLMRVGGTFFGNHQFRDMGTFQVYYRGALAISTGVYARYGTPHWKAWYHQTLAHNGLLIFDPDEPVDRISMVNTGGQRVPNGADHPPDLATLRTGGYELARTTGQAFGPDPLRPQYSYIAGDITKAYTGKVDLVTRSMVTLRLDDPTYPAALVVFDRVDAADPSFRKTWLLHTPQEPQIRGRTTTVTRDEGAYHGRMEVRTLLPEAAQLRKIGGPDKDFWVESADRNFPATLDDPQADVGIGGWRVEVSPAEPRASDRFLHVMTVMDADVESGPQVRMLDTDAVVGVGLLDRVVMFGRAKGSQAEVSFEVPAVDWPTTKPLRILVCDLVPGYWNVVCDGKPLHVRLPVTQEAASLNFEGPPGHYLLRRVDETCPPAPESEFWRPTAGS